MNNSQNDPIWQPFTQMKLALPPIHIERAKDCTLFAKDGRQFIDAISSWWVNIHGHANETIAKQIAEQALKMEHIIFAGFTHSPAIDLANGLLSVLPDTFRKIFYSDNGSTAVEVALKMSLQFWYNQDIFHKTKIIAFENAYHGDTFGAMSIGGKSTFNAAFEKHMFQVEFIPVPNAQNIESVKMQLTELLKTDAVAAFIFEPLIQGSGGMLMHQPEHLDQLIAIAQQKDVICIADEVMTGFGRTGKIFAIDYLQHKPDVICLSKGITGGFMPLGVTATTQKIFDAFYSSDRTKTFFHGHSYTANALSCAAANASLKLLVDPKCQQQIQFIAQSHSQIAKTLHGNKYIKEIRQQGTIIAFDFKTKENTSYFNTLGQEMYQFCISKGVLLRPLGNVLYIMPPYCITTDELQRVYEVINGLIEEFDLSLKKYFST